MSRSLGSDTVNLAFGSYSAVQAVQMLRRNADLSPRVIIYDMITDTLRRNISACAPSYFRFCLDISHAAWTSDGDPIIVPPRSDGVARIAEHLDMVEGGKGPVRWLIHGLNITASQFVLLRDRWTDGDPLRQERALEFLLAELSQTAQQLKAFLLVVYLPTTQLTPAPEALVRVARKLNIDFVDLTEAHKEHQARYPDVSLFLARDGHPSVAGHRLIGEAIAAYIAESHLSSLELGHLK